MGKKTSALDIQVGGNHYKTGKIQPVEFLEANPQFSFTQCNVIKYTSRLGLKGDTPAQRKANTIQDLAKIRHYLDLYEQLANLR